MVIGAPYVVSGDLLDHFKISLVCHGTRSPCDPIMGPDPYAVPRLRGIFETVDSECDLTTQKIVNRIIEHRWVGMNE